MVFEFIRRKVHEYVANDDRIKDIEKRMSKLEARNARYDAEELHRMASEDYDNVKRRLVSRKALEEAFDSMPTQDAMMAVFDLLETKQVKFMGFRLTRNNLRDVKRELERLGSNYRRFG